MILGQIESARARNNINWIALLKIALEHAPKETAEVLDRINETDDEVSLLTKQLMEKWV